MVCPRGSWAAGAVGDAARAALVRSVLGPAAADERGSFQTTLSFRSDHHRVYSDDGRPHLRSASDFGATDRRSGRGAR